MLFPVKGSELKGKIEALVATIEKELQGIPEGNYSANQRLSTRLERYKRMARSINGEDSYQMSYEDLEEFGF